MENGQLVLETLIEAKGYLNKVLAGIDYIVDQLVAGREDVALNTYVQLLDGLEWLTNVISLTGPKFAELGKESLNTAQMNEVIEQLIEAFENRDYVLVGDVLNYELKPIILEWIEGFKFIESEQREDGAFQ